jgi:hypothetical protein
VTTVILSTYGQVTGHVSGQVSGQATFSLRWSAICPPCYPSVQRCFMPGHVTCYPSDTSVQCCFIPGHVTRHASDTSVQSAGHVACYASDTSAQCAGHVVCCASLQCCFMPGHAICYTSDTSVQRHVMSGLATCYALYHYISGHLTGLFAFPIYFLKFDPATNPSNWEPTVQPDVSLI